MTSAPTEAYTTSCTCWKTGATDPLSITRVRWRAFTTQLTIPGSTSAVPPYTGSQREISLSTWTSPFRQACRPERRCSATWKAWGTGSCLRHAWLTNNPLYESTSPRSARIGVFVALHVLRFSGACGEAGVVCFPFWGRGSAGGRAGRRDWFASLSGGGLRRGVDSQIGGPAIDENLPGAGGLSHKDNQVFSAFFAALAHGDGHEHFATAEKETRSQEHT